MRIVIIGAVAAGTSAAAKARRNNAQAQIVVYEKDGFISYSGCGMPYYLGGQVKKAEELTPRDPAFFKSKYNVDIHIQHEVLSLDTHKKELKIRKLLTGEIFSDHYDKLVIATGARAVIPPIKGNEFPHVFTLRTVDDMYSIEEFIHKAQPGEIVIIGTGFVGLEACESLKELGMKVSMVEKLPQVTPGLDSDMAAYVEEHLEQKGVTVYKSALVKEISKTHVILSDGREIKANMVLLATGVQPNTDLASKAGIELGVAGAIRVNTKMQTNILDIYACGDCIEQFNPVTGKPVYRPLGSTANKTGRIAGDCVTGGDLEFRGILGTGIFRIFDLTVAQTGLSEREAVQLGYDPAVCHNAHLDKPEYMDGKEMIIKGVADKKTGRMLGVQIVGHGGVDKRIDVFATAITFQAKAEDLFHLDLAYAPPYSTAKDPVMYTGMILDNKIKKGRS